MDHSASTVTAHLRAALNDADLLPLTGLLDPAVRWTGPDTETADACGRTSVLARLGLLHRQGRRCRVDETFTYPEAVVLGLTTDTGGQGDPPRPGYTVFHLADGRITRIHGHHDRFQALDCAYTASATHHRDERGGP
jgi:hypothetical protein